MGLVDKEGSGAGVRCTGGIDVALKSRAGPGPPS